MATAVARMPQQVAGIGTMGDHDQGMGSTSDNSTIVPPSVTSGHDGTLRLGSLLPWLSRFDTGRFVAAELMVLVAVIACFSQAQSDTYWHLAAGRAMAQTGHVMLTDEFSHTNYGAPWANYEWLSQVVFFLVYSEGGMPLLTAMCAFFAFGSGILAWKLMRGSIEDRVLILALVLPLITPGWSLRPQAFTMFFLVAVVHLVLRERFWVLPFMFLLWANLHAAVALGLVVLVADLIAAVASKRNCTTRVTFGALSFGATLITPLGLSLWPEVWRSLNRSHVNSISEWLPPVLAPKYLFFWLIASSLIWLAATRWRRLDRREDRTLVVLSILMLILAVRASRNIGPFALVAAPAISRLLWHRVAQRRPALAPGYSLGTALRVSLFAVSLVVALFVVHRRWTMAPPPADWAPVSREAAAAIRGCPGPIYNHYNAGGFIIWFVPEQRVFLDSRQDPYPDQLMLAQREARGTVALGELLDRYRVRCAVVEPGSPEVSALRSIGWTEGYRDKQWAVFTLRTESVRH